MLPRLARVGRWYKWISAVIVTCRDQQVFRARLRLLGRFPRGHSLLLLVRSRLVHSYGQQGSAVTDFGSVGTRWVSRAKRGRSRCGYGYGFVKPRLVERG